MPNPSHPPAGSARPRDPFARLIAVQTAHPLPVLGLLSAVTAGSLLLAVHLKLMTGFESLLPESRPSVI